MRTWIYFLMGLCSHFSSTTPTALTRTQSATNMDSNYVGITGHVGTIGDSLADSIYMPILANGLSRLTNPAYIDVGVQTADTLTDSVFCYNLQTDSVVCYGPCQGYKYVKPVRTLVYRAKMFKGANDVYFPWSFGPYAGVGEPDLLQINFKMKLKSGKGAHVMRIIPNFIRQ